jgi:ComF family protein
VYFTSVYSGIAEQLIHELKFEYRRQAVEPMAKTMSAVLPAQEKDVLLCPIPTAPPRIRERGFDHCELLCRELARKTDLQQKNLLQRLTNTRQVGSSRQARFDQTREGFKILEGVEIKNRSILLVDDVMTSGATLSAAAKLLKKSGAKEVNALIFARK